MQGVRGQEAENIFLSDIARVLCTTLLFGRKLYGRFGYSGLTEGAVQLTGAWAACQANFERPRVADGLSFGD